MSSDDTEEMGKLMLSYLPAIYRMDAESQDFFLEKFLGIFGSEIIKMEELIADIPRYFDPQALTSDEEDFLSWLTGWLSLALFSQYSSLNREYMLMACQFYRNKGTEAGVIALLEFFTDGKACVQDRSSLIFRTFIPGWKDEYHSLSLTLDTTKPEIINNMHKYGDTVHYIFSGELFVIDAYLHGIQGTDEEKMILKKLVEPFVPAMWSLEINGMARRKLLGNDDVSWDRSALSSGILGMQKFTAVKGNLSEIRIKCAGNCHIQVAIYSDLAGSPGSVLAYAMAAPVSSGWNTISLNTTIALTATSYWLAYIIDTSGMIWMKNTGGTFKYRGDVPYGSPFPNNPSGLISNIYDMAIAGWGF